MKFPENIAIGITTQDEVRKLYGDPLRESIQFDHPVYIYPGQKLIHNVVGFDEAGKVLFYSMSTAALEIPPVLEKPLRFKSNYAHGSHLFAYPKNGYSITVTSNYLNVSILFHAKMDTIKYHELFGKFYPTTDPFYQ